MVKLVLCLYVMRSRWLRSLGTYLAYVPKTKATVFRVALFVLALKFGAIFLVYIYMFGKLFTKIINDRLNKWAENCYVYVESQASFMSKMGTVDKVFFVLNALINHFLIEEINKTNMHDHSFVTLILQSV